MAAYLNCSRPLIPKKWFGIHIPTQCCNSFRSDSERACQNWTGIIRKAPVQKIMLCTQNVKFLKALLDYRANDNVMMIHRASLLNCYMAFLTVATWTNIIYMKSSAQVDMGQHWQVSRYIAPNTGGCPTLCVVVPGTCKTFFTGVLSHLVN